MCECVEGILKKKKKKKSERKKGLPNPISSLCLCYMPETFGGHLNEKTHKGIWSFSEFEWEQNGVLNRASHTFRTCVCI